MREAKERRRGGRVGVGKNGSRRDQAREGKVYLKRLESLCETFVQNRSIKVA